MAIAITQVLSNPVIEPWFSLEANPGNVSEPV